MRLKRARLEAGLSQEGLGVLVGIDEFSASARMNQYEKGAYAPSFDLMVRIAAVLGMPVEYFYAPSEESAQLILRFHQLGVNERKAVLDLIEQLRDLIK